MIKNSDLLFKQMLFCLRERKDIPNPLIYQFSELIIKMIRNQEEIHLTQNLADLIDKTDAFWRQADKTRLDGEVVFNVGRVFSLTTIMKKYFESESSYYSPIEFANKYSKRLKLFKKIQESPGIIHKELANYSNMSESALSQLMVSLHGDGIITSRKVGRNKFYYLTKLGVTILEEMETQQRPLNNTLKPRFALNNKIIEESRSNLRPSSYLMHDIFCLSTEKSLKVDAELSNEMAESIY